MIGLVVTAIAACTHDFEHCSMVLTDAWIPKKALKFEDIQDPLDIRLITSNKATILEDLDFKYNKYSTISIRSSLQNFILTSF